MFTCHTPRLQMDFRRFLNLSTRHGLRSRLYMGKKIHISQRSAKNEKHGSPFPTFRQSGMPGPGQTAEHIAQVCQESHSAPSALPPQWPACGQSDSWSVWQPQCSYPDLQELSEIPDVKADALGRSMLGNWLLGVKKALICSVYHFFV